MEKLFTRKEAAEYLGISLTRLDEARRRREIAYIQYNENGKIFFTQQALEEFVARATHRAKPININAPVRETYRKPRKKW